MDGTSGQSIGAGALFGPEGGTVQGLQFVEFDSEDRRVLFVVFAPAGRVAQLLSGHEYPPHLAEFLGVSQRTSSKKLFTWEAQSRFMPMVTIGQKPVFLDDAATLQALASAEFRPREVVYLPPEARGSVPATADPAAKIVSSQVTASACQFETEASRATMLVVAQSWHYCWVAEIDGRAAPLLRAITPSNPCLFPPDATKSGWPIKTRCLTPGRFFRCCPWFCARCGRGGGREKLYIGWQTIINRSCARRN